jgi:hypothetical protein
MSLNIFGQANPSNWPDAKEYGFEANEVALLMNYLVENKVALMTKYGRIGSIGPYHYQVRHFEYLGIKNANAALLRSDYQNHKDFVLLYLQRIFFEYLESGASYNQAKFLALVSFIIDPALNWEDTILKEVFDDFMEYYYSSI